MPARDRFADALGDGRGLTDTERRERDHALLSRDEQAHRDSLERERERERRRQADIAARVNAAQDALRAHVQANTPACPSDAVDVVSRQFPDEERIFINNVMLGMCADGGEFTLNSRLELIADSDSGAPRN